MGGKIWSRDEERTFWTAIVPSSNKRLLMDRPSARNPRGWAQLASTMQDLMGSLARRRYTPLMLYEHFFQNAVLETFSPSARPFAEAYINEELRTTGHRPSERSRTIMRAPISQVLASRRRATVQSLLFATPRRSSAGGSSGDGGGGEGEGEGDCDESTPPTSSSSYDDDKSTAPSHSDSFLSPALEAEVQKHMHGSATPGDHPTSTDHAHATAATLAGQLPLPPPYEGLFQPLSSSGRSSNVVGMHEYPPAFEHARLPPIATTTAADPATTPATDYAKQYAALPSLSVALAAASAMEPSSSSLSIYATREPVQAWQQETDAYYYYDTGSRQQNTAYYDHHHNNNGYFDQVPSEMPPVFSSTSYDAHYTPAVWADADATATQMMQAAAAPDASAHDNMQPRFPMYDPALELVPGLVGQQQPAQAAHQGQPNGNGSPDGASELNDGLFVAQW